MKKFKYDYDSENDSLFIYDPKEKSKASIELGDFIIDFNTKKNLCAIELINASKILAGDIHKYVVKSCYDDVERIIRFGARGYQDYTQHKDPKRKKSFRARHRCDKVTDKNTARYWSCEYLWNTKDK